MITASRSSSVNASRTSRQYGEFSMAYSSRNSSGFTSAGRLLRPDQPRMNDVSVDANKWAGLGMAKPH